MIKKKSRILSQIVIVLTIIGCFPSASDKTTEIDYKSWNTDTFRFIEKKCGLIINDSLNLGREVVPVKQGGNIFNTTKDYLKSKIKGRVQLANYLKEHIEVYESIYIFESYGRDIANLLVSIDGEKSLRFSYKNDTLKFSKTEKAGTSENLFNPLDKDEQECFANYVSIPQRLMIFSRYDAANKSTVTYKVSMYD